MELGGGGGGGFWDLSSALNPAPPLLPFNQHETMAIHGGLQGIPAMDPHLTCLKLGKRHYFEDAGDRPHPSVNHLLGGKKGKGFGGGSSSSSPAATAGPVPRCQVEGCSMVLVHAKDYHRRHKVCEMHSKAPKVVVLGLEQRFCQQCSRFHVVTEFDDTKRSCRRRLAGHNERRRKSSNESMGKMNPPQADHRAAGGRYQCMHPSPHGAGALSLLSSTSYASDLSRLSSAALRELIAENRAAVLARQLFSSQPTCPHPFFPPSQVADQAPRWSSHFQEHATLDLMQTPASSSYPPLAPGGRRRAKEDDECCDMWKSVEGAAHVDIC